MKNIESKKRKNPPTYYHTVNTPPNKYSKLTYKTTKPQHTYFELLSSELISRILELATKHRANKVLPLKKRLSTNYILNTKVDETSEMDNIRNISTDFYNHFPRIYKNSNNEEILFISNIYLNIPKKLMIEEINEKSTLEKIQLFVNSYNFLKHYAHGVNLLTSLEANYLLNLCKFFSKITLDLKTLDNNGLQFLWSTIAQVNHTKEFSFCIKKAKNFYILINNLPNEEIRTEEMAKFMKTFDRIDFKNISANKIPFLWPAIKASLCKPSNIINIDILINNLHEEEINCPEMAHFIKNQKILKLQNIEPNKLRNLWQCIKNYKLYINNTSELCAIINEIPISEINLSIHEYFNFDYAAIDFNLIIDTDRIIALWQALQITPNNKVAQPQSIFGLHHLMNILNEEQISSKKMEQFLSKVEYFSIIDQGFDEDAPENANINNMLKVKMPYLFKAMCSSKMPLYTFADLGYFINILPQSTIASHDMQLLLQNLQVINLEDINDFMDLIDVDENNPIDYVLTNLDIFLETILKSCSTPTTIFDIEHMKKLIDKPEKHEQLKSFFIQVKNISVDLTEIGYDSSFKKLMQLLPSNCTIELKDMMIPDDDNDIV